MIWARHLGLKELWNLWRISRHSKGLLEKFHSIKTCLSKSWSSQVSSFWKDSQASEKSRYRKSRSSLRLMRRWVMIGIQLKAMVIQVDLHLKRNRGRLRRSSKEIQCLWSREAAAIWFWKAWVFQLMISRDRQQWKWLQKIRSLRARKARWAMLMEASKTSSTFTK